MIENQAVTKSAMSRDDLQALEIEMFEIDELIELDVNAPFEISTSSTTSSSCG